MSKESSQLHNMVKQRYSGSKWAGEDIIHKGQSEIIKKSIVLTFQ
jgi:hypothetical protein